MNWLPLPSGQDLAPSVPGGPYLRAQANRKTVQAEAMNRLLRNNDWDVCIYDQMD